MSATVYEYDDINQVDKSVWDLMVSDDMPYLKHDYLQAVQDLFDTKCCYFVVNNDGVPVACASVSEIKTDLSLFLFRKSTLKRCIAAIRKVFPNFLYVTVLECGPSAMSGEGFSSKNWLIEIAKQMMKMKAHLCVIRDFAEPNKDLSILGFSPVPNFEEAILDIKWRTFGEYLASLKSHYRSIIAKEDKKLNQLRTEVVKEFAQHAETMAVLWANTNGQAKTDSREIINADYFRRISDTDNVLTTLYWLDEKLVAFTVALVGANVLFGIWMGVDYTHNKQYPLVFATYYAAIKMAISTNKQKLFFGETTYGPKLRMGAILYPSFGYCKTRYRWLTKLLSLVAFWTTPKQVETEKNVFKTTT